MIERELTRRGLLAGGFGALLLAGCTPTSQTPTPTVTSGPQESEDATPRVARVTDLIGQPSFVVAHRGSGDNWPEHTLTAYQNAVAAGADAVEISVCATSDGVLVCHHDKSARRVLGVDQPIAEMSWARLHELTVDARPWLGPDTPLEPVSRLDDVLAALGEDVLVFIEDKQGTNTRALLDLLDTQPRATERFVWKQWAQAAQIAVAKERGYVAWGYLDVEPTDRLDELASTFDILGVPVAMHDDDIAEVVATGVPVMAWEVHLHDDVTRLAELGVAGLMCSNVEYLFGDGPASTDTFAGGRRAAGDLPADYDRIGWASQPTLVPDRAALRIERAGSTSYLMGSLATPAGVTREVEVTIRWPEALPPTGRAGLVLALTGDANGGDGDRGLSSGYELSLDGTGLLELRARDAGRTAETLGSVHLAVPRAGDPIPLAVEVDQHHIRVRQSGGALLLEVPDERWRGSWLRLFKDYETAQAVEFSAVSVLLD
ncbi:glycerophosphodiester phosphodiesterase [Pseudactinotalea suaedae]|uniref:glycerophosphodiester phosphodiesterase n=1 Tax=Pseudactinotalea suaedae TaxID=1524924 RepID=UPI0012E2C119|nr:glycerophosphodiester phosphodiesterase [Pseudactinotalea suaedae]